MDNIHYHCEPRDLVVASLRAGIVGRYALAAAIAMGIERSAALCVGWALITSDPRTRAGRYALPIAIAMHIGSSAARSVVWAQPGCSRPRSRGWNVLLPLQEIEGLPRTLLHRIGVNRKCVLLVIVANAAAIDGSYKVPGVRLEGALIGIGGSNLESLPA